MTALHLVPSSSPFRVASCRLAASTHLPPPLAASVVCLFSSLPSNFDPSLCRRSYLSTPEVATPTHSSPPSLPHSLSSQPGPLPLQGAQHPPAEGGLWLHRQQVALLRLFPRDDHCMERRPAADVLRPQAQRQWRSQLSAAWHSAAWHSPAGAAQGAPGRRLCRDVLTLV